MPEAFFQEDIGPEPVWPAYLPEGGSSVENTVVSAFFLAVGFGALCAAGRLLAQNTEHTATFWAANGVLTAFLLCRRKNLWWTLLVASWFGGVTANLLSGAPVFLGALLAFCNVTEAATAAVLLRRVFDRDRDLASAGTMVQFLLFAVILAPAASGVLGAACYHLVLGVDFWHVLARWFPSHALGMAVMTPLILGLLNPALRKIFRRGRLLRSAGVLLLILFASIVVFEQTHYSLRFVCLPLLMLVVFEVGILGAVAAIFEISVVGAFYTLRGHGPLWMEKGATMQGSILVLQFAMLLFLMSVVPFAAMVERQRHLHRRLRHGMERYQLLADNSRDIVVLSNLEGRRLYVSPAVEDALGWTRQEWTGSDSADFMHPDDVPAFRRMLKEMLHGEDRRTFRYRTQHKDGRYIWMEANVRTLPDQITGEPNAFVANVRDISLRVDAEQKLAEVHQHVQQQAQRDSLTELANRRCFDEALDREWRRGRRIGSPLALLMVDIDDFKRINDTYGHRAGDCCLRDLAAILRQMARRPGDITSRYGGDEFAVLLPDVDHPTAMMLAEGLCLKVREQLFQAGIGRALTLTVSVGVSAQIPRKNTRADFLVEAADRALYAAKQQGRDRASAKSGIEAPAAMLLHPVQ